jgi:uncharacterized protein (DUF58 family)
MSRTHALAPSELSALRDLELVTRVTVEGLRQGLHRSPFHGYSAEFSQYRHYRPGDDLKYVDWKAFGRTDRLYSRQFRETTNLGALFVVDVSRSMAFPAPSPGRPSKFRLAASIAAILATLVIDQGDQAGLLAVGGEEASEFLPPRSGRHHLHALLAALARLEPRSTFSIHDALRRAGTVMRRRGLIVVLSDFYEDAPALGELRRLSRMGHDVVAVHTIASEEESLTGGDAAEFVDLETGSALVLDPRAIGDEYRRAFTAFLNSVETAVRRDGLGYLRIRTTDPLEPALRRFLIGRRSAA